MALPFSSEMATKPTKIMGRVPTFSGDRLIFPSWKQLVKLHLEVDFCACSAMVRFAAVLGSLQGEAQQQAMVWLRARGASAPSAGEGPLMAQLDRLYDDPHRADNATTKLRTCAQDGRPFTDYLHEVELLCAEAGFIDNHQRLNYLVNGLGPALRRVWAESLKPQLSIDGRGPDYSRACQQLDQVDNDQRLCGGLSGAVREGLAGPAAAARAPGQAADPDVEMTDIAALRAEISQLRAERRPGPWQPQGPQRRPPRRRGSGDRSDSWRAKCRARGLCYTCGDKGHRAADCPEKQVDEGESGKA